MAALAIRISADDDAVPAFDRNESTFIFLAFFFGGSKQKFTT